MSPVDQDEVRWPPRKGSSRNAGGKASAPSWSAAITCATLTVLRELRAARGEAFGLVLLDSHTDLYPPYFGGKTLTHGNPFRQAIEEGCLDPTACVMIGMRGTSYNNDDFQYGWDRGVRIVPIEECMDLGWPAVMQIAREVVGARPAYVSFDIDFVDPAYAPGTGTPEVGGPTSFEAISCVRALHGLDIIGTDLVEVAPPFDTGGITSWLGASVMFELLCAMQAA